MKDFIERSGLVDLPTELLVYIFSFLSAVRDKVALCVSRIRSAIEVPLLWMEFVWSNTPAYHTILSQRGRAYMHAYSTLFFCLCTPSPCPPFLVNPVWWSHVIEDLTTVYYFYVSWQ